MTRLLGILLLLAVVPLAQTQSTPKGKSEDALKRDLQKVNRQQEKIRAKLRDNRRKTAVVRTDLREVDNRLETVETNLEVTTNRLQRGRQEQRRAATELELATERLALKKEKVRQRLKAMYMMGPVPPLQAAVNAKDIGDIATRKEILERIAQADRELFERYKELRDEVAQRKRTKDRLVVRVAGLVQEQKEQQEELQDVRQEKAKTLQQLRSERSRLSAILRQFEADEAEIAAQIRAFSRRPIAPGSLPARTGRLMRPVNGRVTSGWGMRFHPILRVRRLHTGIDFGVPSGTPIRAAQEGIVISATYMRGYGNTVIIQHGGNVQTLYAHCSRLMVSTGQRVRQGQVIAAVGSTGYSTGPHLHFEVRINGRPVNPASWI